MDIQKEREAFKKYIQTAAHPHRSPKVMFFTVNDGHGNVIYCDISIQNQWETWQAAKAQADQKVKLLLCDEHLKKCESPTGIFNSQDPDEEPCLICLAKEAKAQAVPEGFVLVPKEPTYEMLEAGSEARSRTEGHIASIWEAMIEAQEPAND